MIKESKSTATYFLISSEFLFLKVKATAMNLQINSGQAEDCDIADQLPHDPELLAKKQRYAALVTWC